MNIPRKVKNEGGARLDTAVSEFKVTYYVGVMLAQGGVLKIMEDHLLFVPRNIEKAMGASDVEIPFEEIKLVEVTGAITESLMVRTQEKPHRFVGSSLEKVAEQINGALARFNVSSPAASRPSQTSKPSSSANAASSQEKTGSLNSCPSCFKMIKQDYNFCPACGTSIKKVCATWRWPIRYARTT